MKIKLSVLSLLLMTFLVSGASAWDMGDPTDSNSFSSDSSGLIGKSVHIVMFDDDYESHIVTKLTGVTLGMLQTSDWYYQSSNSFTPTGRWDHLPGTHWISIGAINMMWEEPLPTEAVSEETPAQPGFGSILAILGLVTIAFALNRRS